MPNIKNINGWFTGAAKFAAIYYLHVGGQLPGGLPHPLIFLLPLAVIMVDHILFYE